MPPMFNRECPAGISPFIPQEMWKQYIHALMLMWRFHEELRRKLLNIRTDAIARKEGRFQDATWKEAYIKKSVKKKQAKTRTCELCHIQFHNYVQVHLDKIIHY